jgi:phytoene desaturase
MFLMPRVYRSIFADWGEDVGRLGLRPLDPLYTIHFEDAAPFAFSADRIVLREQIDGRAPGAYDRWRRYDDLGRRQYRELMRRVIGRNFRRASDYFRPSNIGWFFRLGAHRKHASLARRLLRNPELEAAFTFQNIYAGQSPFTSSAAYALLPALEVRQGGDEGRSVFNNNEPPRLSLE